MACNIEDCKTVFEKYAKEDIGIISVSISSKISSTYGVAAGAAQKIMEAYPNAKIYCFDSYRMSGAIAILMVYAHMLKKEGKKYEYTLTVTENAIVSNVKVVPWIDHYVDL